MKMTNFSCAIVAFLISSFGVMGQDNMETQSVSVFKNGSAFFVKKGQVDVKDGSYFLNSEVPKAVIGTLWFSASEGGIDRVKMHTMTTQKVRESRSEFKSSAFGPMLEANMNKKLTLFMHDELSLTGTVEKVDEGYFLFNTGSKWVNLKTSSLQRIEFLSKPIFPDSVNVRRDTIRTESNGLMIDFSSKNTSQELGMMYLEKGIGWVPTYNINLLTENKARLKLHAVVSNHAEDFKNADLNFVVGVPNFLQQDNVTPLSQGGLQSVNQFYNSISIVGSDLSFDFANRGGSRIVYGIDRSSNFASGESSGLEGFSSEDLFFYNLRNVSMKRGESAQFSILQADINVKHIYEVQLEESNVGSYYYRGIQSKNGFSFDESFKNKVWHSIKFKNTANSPLTAGVVMVTNSEDGTARPISQDKITYTPAGAETFLKLTVAPDVSVRDGEVHKNVEEKSDELEGYWYDKVTVEGEIRVQNYKSKKIDLNIRKRITGDLANSNMDWLKSSLVDNRQVNEITDVCWEISLKPGEKRTVKYTYTVLVKR